MFRTEKGSHIIPQISQVQPGNDTNKDILDSFKGLS